GDLQIDPLGATRCPHPDTVARADAQAPETARRIFDLFMQIQIGKSQVLMARHDGVALGILPRGVFERLANGLFEKRQTRPARVAQHDAKLYYASFECPCARPGIL